MKKQELLTIADDIYKIVNEKVDGFSVEDIEDILIIRYGYRYISTNNIVCALEYLTAQGILFCTVDQIYSA